MPPIIQLEKVNFWYDRGKPAEVWAIQNVSIDIQHGEYVAFFGPSGCGKTSLLYAISGIEQPQGGKVVVSEKDISRLSPNELAKYRQDGIGIVFQGFNLLPSLTILANVALPMAFLGVRPRERDKKAAVLLDRLAIKHLANRYPHELSGGQQQRVGIARALANDPPIIVADEPLGNLDSENANKVLEFLKELNEKDGRTIVMVTHEAWSLRDAKRVFFMRDGKILKSEETHKRPELAKSITEHLFQELITPLSTEGGLSLSPLSPSGAGPGYIPSPGLVAQTLSVILLRGYSPEEVQRFRKFLQERFEDKLTAGQFRYKLDQSLREGGVGLWAQKARNLGEYVEKIISERHHIQSFYKRLAEHHEASLQSETEDLRVWMLEEYEGKIGAAQRKHLDLLIQDRIRGKITPEMFRERLHAPTRRAGAGISFRAAQHASERMETILEGSGAPPLPPPAENPPPKNDSDSKNEPIKIYEEQKK
ncbi:MAG: ABC transporter ATP-binding protein [Nanoarchaeota archaeon]|nr:ABC transporter ATP-binding protein [Nanoarchaeota archaeon]